MQPTSLDAHHRWISEAISLARVARERGDHPFGAVVVRADAVIAAKGNTVITGEDVTAHAEMNAIRELERLGISDRQDLVLYCSTEPCAMCCGALYWAGLRHVVFGCSSEALERLAGPGLGLHARAILGSGAQATEVIGPLLEDQAIEVHVGVW
jgi:tRNA(Arg) A34 adenosine deaminase TadA